MKIEDIIKRDHHRTHHLATSSVSASSTTKLKAKPGVTSIKRSSSLAINAPFPKNHKNETTCTKMSDETNTISATAKAIKNGLNGAIINSSLSSSSSSNSASSVSSGTVTVAAVTDNRIQVSRANPIHSGSNHNHQHSTSNNNETTSTTTTTTLSSRHVSGMARIKVESSSSVENNGGGGKDYSTCKTLVGGGAATEVVGRIPTSSTTVVAAGVVGGGSVQGIGGRLQFFKDGKFILELARAKEGEKSGWVSVPRKQFRSPSATSSTVTPTYPKNESSTSLSFSDDNSSIQSSPWQRDHCWKQSTPRRDISKEMCFHFKRIKQIIVSSNSLKTARLKRRRPLDNSVCQTPFRVMKNGCSKAAEIILEPILPDEDGTASIDDVKSSDGSSGEKEESSRESSKTPTPESQIDTLDRLEVTKTNDSQATVTARTMNGEKRLKTRAKLTTIIQKLIDRLPTSLFHLSKTQIIGGATQQQQQQYAHSHSHHHQSHSSHHIPSTSSRLASELHYHQQHVSPRKRILREFEKVSLEETPTINSKRSRAKGNSSIAAAVGTLPLTPIPTSRGVVVPSSSSNYVTNGSRTEAVSSNNNSNMTTNTTPTRLYSSYSIHSLLGGNSNSTSNNNNNSSSNASNIRVKVEHLGNQSGVGGGYNDPSYLRAMLASPKSPEGCTSSKSSPFSSSTSGSAKKRSPPYSPLNELHQQHQSRNRSPNVDASYGSMRSPPEAHTNKSYGAGNTSRLTPPHGYLSSPKNSNSNSSLVDGYKIKSENVTNSSPNHHFYSPYMLSPKYVPPPGSISPSNQHTSDSYHHQKLKGAKSPSQQNFRSSVFRTQSPHATTNHHRESSPIATHSSSSPRGGGMTASSPSSTPRTVPKKTVSIRRQFASPSSSSSSPGLGEHLKNVGNSLSKVEERTAMSPDNRRTPTQESAAAASKYHQQAAAAAAAAAMMQRSSPLGGGASSLYYMYPPPNGSPSPHHSSSSPSPSPSSSYIPQINPYYHPYVSTLAAIRNPLWMHHYSAAAAAAAAAGAAAAMLPSSAAGPVPPQAMPFFPYNGAAATTPSHMHHTSFAPMHLAAGGQLGLHPPPPPAILNRSPPTTDDTISPSSIKDEHSSDVPLNLSKH